MKLDLFNSLTILSLYSGGLLAIYFFAARKGNIIGNRLLSGLLITFCLQIIYSFTTSDFAYLYYLQWHKLIFAIKQGSFLTGPFIYLYIRSFRKQAKQLHWYDIFHGVPFLAALAFLYFFYKGKEQFIMWGVGLNFPFTALILLSNLIYIILSITTMVSLPRSAETSFTATRTDYPMTWLKFVLLGFIGLWIIELNAFVIVIIIGNLNWCPYSGSIFALTIFLFIVLVMLLVFVKPEILYSIEKYRHSDLTETDKSEHLQRIHSYMTSGKPYKEPDFSLQTLSESLGLSTRVVSQVVNEKFGINVKSYINEFRLKESMEMLTAPDNTDKTVLEILYEVGFNSKSAFNLQFKKFTGLTPQEYRQKMSRQTAS